jgi:ZIP family zinc transporter
MGLDLEIAAWIFASGLATAVGAVALWLSGPRLLRAILLDGLLGFTAGVMLAATLFSLLVPAIDRGSLLPVVVGLAAGGFGMMGVDALVPHAHARFREGRRPRAAAIQPAQHRATLLISALTIHNVPEGLAVGVAFGVGGTELGIPVALAIGVQNIPEGFVAGAPLLETGMARGRASLIAGSTGLVEPPAALLAFFTAEAVGGALGGALAFAAGAMLYVVIDELIPECQARGNERIASGGLLIGFIVMMTLDNALG